VLPSLTDAHHSIKRLKSSAIPNLNATECRFTPMPTQTILIPTLTILKSTNLPSETKIILQDEAALNKFFKPTKSVDLMNHSYPKSSTNLNVKSTTKNQIAEKILNG
jgi:hypothetical protein